MLGLELVVVIGMAVLVCGVLAHRLRVGQPVLLLAAGALLDFLPALCSVEFPHEVVLFLFLPVLLYWESMNTSLREMRRSLRGVVLVGTLLVMATAAAVAAVAHGLGMPWGRPGSWGRPSRPPMPRRSPPSSASCLSATSPRSRPRAWSTTAPHPGHAGPGPARRGPLGPLPARHPPPSANGSAPKPQPPRRPSPPSTTLPPVWAPTPRSPNSSGTSYETHLRVLAATPRADDDLAQEGATVLRRHQQMTELRPALLARKRSTIISLRDDNKIDDAVLLHLQAQLDTEETRLRRTAPPNELVRDSG